ncbi:MAG: DUF3019 domain-containing protein [Kangiellaceae bacterium]|nr:DUF3019 domain-containing protein [Kangiellaceae bacterium]MCW9000151.1 DUF3019 domain-containing protein [Kangiellaceae bacterium]
MIIILMSCQALRAEQINTKQVMTVSPGKCVVKTRGEACLVKLDFEFRLDKPGDFCVYQYGQYQALFCFSEVMHSQSISFKTSKDTRLVLVDRLTGDKVAFRDFSVLTYKPAKIRKRRKRAWGIL